MTEETKEQIQRLAIEALLTDGVHHKHWFLERILEAVGVNLEQLAHEMLRSNDREWNKGIAP